MSSLGVQLGCDADLVVGIGGGGAAAFECPGCAADEVQKGLPECATADESNTEWEDYESWRKAPNDMPELAGTVWVGHIETSEDLRFWVDERQTAYLGIGGLPYPKPEKDKGYLCGHTQDLCDADQPIRGGIYPVHGAEFNPARQRLLIVLSPRSPFEQWCRLQTPRQKPLGTEGKECAHATFWDKDVSDCIADGEKVDCGWLAVAAASPCECTSAFCFPVTQWVPPAANIAREGFVVDLTYDDSNRRFEGSIRSYGECCTAKEGRIQLFPATAAEVSELEDSVKTLGLSGSR